MVGALVGIVLSAWPLPPPPTDDVAACREWAVKAANVLAVTPQPPVPSLEGASAEGLADVPLEAWNTLETFHPDKSPEALSRRRAVLDGEVPLESAPELVGEAVRLEPIVRRVLSAARSNRDELPRSLQNWSIFVGPRTPTHLTLQNVLLLANVLAQRSDPDHGIGICLESWALLRSLGGSGLIGQMVAASQTSRLRTLCLATARLSSPEQRRRLRSGLETVASSWPPLSTTLEQELVFAQVAIFSTRWSDSLVRRLPAVALNLREGARAKDPGWLTVVRWKLFGGWAGGEACLLLAGAIQSADAPPEVADRALQAGGVTPLTLRLAKDELGHPSDDTWVRFARRHRNARLELELLLAVLDRWSGESPLPVRTDPRTGRALQDRVVGGMREVAAPAVPEFEAAELREGVGAVKTSP
jgi:hypothetical protein